MNKILFHHNCLEQGGAERVVANLSNQFAEDGYEVIVATEWQGEKEFELNNRVKRVHVGLSEEQEKCSRFKKAIIRVENLKRLIIEEKPDIAVGFTRNPIYRLLMATRFLKLPVVIAIRTNPVGYYDRKIDRICIPLLFPRVNGAVFQTSGQRAFFPGYIQDRSTIILNPVSEKYVSVNNDNITKKKIIIHSSRLVALKNQKMLLNAFLSVHKRYPEYSLHVYGGDSHDGTKELLEGIIRDNDAQEYIKLMGESNELEKVIPAAEIYAFSSDCEGLPNALIEAMCMGMPVVSTDCPCGGPATLITNEENGLLVPVNDEKAFANAICELIEKPELAKRMGQKAREVSELVEGRSITEQWKNYLEKVISEK